MGKKQEDKKKPATPLHNLTLRQEKIGKKHADVASILKIKHLTRVATWASGEGQIQPLGSMLGQRLSSTAESSGLPPDSSIFLCQKCETILQPGFNCTIRIKKNFKKAKQCKNNVVYTCRFCSHDNLKWGTPKPINLGVPSKNESESNNNAMTPVSKTPPSTSIRNERNDFGSICSNKTSGGSRKRGRQKGWTSLKEKANANAKTVKNFVVPFKM